MLRNPTVHTQTRELTLSHLRDGVSVEIIGVTGAGRSALVAGIADTLEAEGFRTLRIFGVSQLRERPLEALNLSGVVDAARTQRTAPVISSTVELLSTSIARTPTIVVLDDVDDIDEVTLGVLTAAHQRLGFAVLSVSHPSPRGMTALWNPHILAIRPGVRIRLSPLRYDDVHALLVELLGGPVHPDAVSWVNTQSGGLAGLAMAIADTARREGSLVLRDGLWVAEQNLWSPLLATVIERLTERLSPAALDGLYKLSLVGGSEQSTARRLVGAAELEELDERHLVHFLPSRDQIIAAVYPPLVAEYFRRAPIGAKRIRLLDEISEALGGGVNPTDLGQTARTSSEIHVADRAGASTRESDNVLNLLLNEHWTARALLRRAEWEQSPTWVTAAPYLSTLLMWDYDPDIIEHIIDSTRPEGDTESRAMFMLWKARFLAMNKHDLATAEALLLSAEDSSGDLSELLRLERIYLGAILDRLPLDHEERLHTSERSSRRIEQSARAYLAGMHIVRGQAAKAITLLDFETDDVTLARYRDLVLGLAYAFSGDLDRALEWSLRHLREGRANLDIDDIHAYSYVVSLVLTVQGRTAELRESLSSVLSLGNVPLMANLFHVGNLTIAAVVAAREGRTDAASSLIREAEDMGMPSGHLPAMSPVWARAMLGTMAGDTTGPAEDLWEEALTLLDRGYVTAGILTGIGAIEILPDTDRVQALRPFIDQTDGTLLKPLLTYVEALSSGDPDRMSAVGDELLTLDRPRYGLRAHASAIQTWKNKGMLAKATQHFAYAQARATSLGVEYLSWLDPFEAGADLTQREMEVAKLVAQNFSNQEIAERLVLSVRTVESHLHRVFRKVGVDNRQDLTEALSLE